MKLPAPTKKPKSSKPAGCLLAHEQFTPPPSPMITPGQCTPPPSPMITPTPFASGLWHDSSLSPQSSGQSPPPLVLSSLLQDLNLFSEPALAAPVMPVSSTMSSGLESYFNALIDQGRREGDESFNPSFQQPICSYQPDILQTVQAMVDDLRSKIAFPYCTLSTETILLMAERTNELCTSHLQESLPASQPALPYFYGRALPS